MPTFLLTHLSGEGQLGQGGGKFKGGGIGESGRWNTQGGGSREKWEKNIRNVAQFITIQKAHRCGKSNQGGGNREYKLQEAGH